MPILSSVIPFQQSSHHHVFSPFSISSTRSDFLKKSSPLCLFHHLSGTFYLNQRFPSPCLPTFSFFSGPETSSDDTY